MRKCLKGNVQRWVCSNCGRSFVEDFAFRSRFAEGTVAQILDLTVQGNSPTEVSRHLAANGVKVSKQTVEGIVRRCAGVLAGFESKLLREAFGQANRRRLSLFYIDDMFLWISRVEVDGRRLRRYAWLTNVFDQSSRYWLGFYLSPPKIWKRSEGEVELRGARATRAVLERIRSLGVPPPVEVRCDGHLGHILGAKQVLPSTPVVSFTKAENYGFINYIERLHRDIRKYLRRIGKFRKTENLRGYLEVYRAYHNFLRPHEGLGGLVPARMLGVELGSFRGFLDLLRFAHSYLKPRGVEG
ncbi:MAG: DDE-type integrase/transposase/recombinase [Candidatus Hadarchaeales archaeon]